MAIPLIFIMLVKPLWPVAEYIINYDYIVTNRCENKNRSQLQCDGKCYLAKMLAKENGQQEDNPFESHQLNSELVQLVYITLEGSNFYIPIIGYGTKQNTLYLNKKNTPPCINQPTPPPKSFV